MFFGLFKETIAFVLVKRSQWLTLYQQARFQKSHYQGEGHLFCI